MAKKKKKKNGGAVPSSDPPPPTQPAALPAPLSALEVDYSAVMRLRNVRWLIVIAVVIGALALGTYLSSIFVPLLVALAIAYILNPIVVRLEKKFKSRKIAVIIVFAAFVVFCAGFGTWIVSSIANDMRSAVDRASTAIADFAANQEEWIASYNEAVPDFLQVSPDEVKLDAVRDVLVREVIAPSSQVESPEESSARAALISAKAELLASFQRADKNSDLLLDPTEIGAESVKQIDADNDGLITTTEWFRYFGAVDPKADTRTLTPRARSGLSLLGGGLLGILGVILFITLVPIYTWYFMLGFDRFGKKVYSYLPGAHRPRVERLLDEIDGMLRAFFRGRVVVVLIIGAASTALFLAFGIEYAVLLGLLSGLGVLIPYFSIVAGWVPALFLMIIAKDSWPAILGMSVVFHAIQAFEQYYLTPKILGDAVELHPVTLLVGVFVMASLFGVFGALLAVPLTAIAKTLGREFLLPYFRSLAAEKRA